MPMYNAMYPRYMYPMMSAQQRLQQMEQQYPQFAQPNMQTPMMQPQMVQQPAVPIKCRAVTSFDEAKAAMIDLDGSLHVFTDLGNKKIYTKQINLDGTASLNTYNLEEAPPAVNIPETPNINLVPQDIFDQAITILQNQITELKQKFDQRGDDYVQSNANVSRNAKRKPADADV